MGPCRSWTTAGFLDGVPAGQPEQAEYYPEDMTKEEFNTWLSTLDEKTKEQAVGFFTLIRRDARKKLKIVPYSEEYRSWLTRLQNCWKKLQH